MRHHRIPSILAIAATFVSSNILGQVVIDGQWQGVMEREGSSMAVRFDFQTQSGVIKAASVRSPNESWNIRWTKLFILRRQFIGCLRIAEFRRRGFSKKD